jgi:hypothetical protein
LGDGEYNRGTGCGKIARPGLFAGEGPGNRHSYRERLLKEDRNEKILTMDVAG